MHVKLNKIFISIFSLIMNNNAEMQRVNFIYVFFFVQEGKLCYHQNFKFRHCEFVIFDLNRIKCGKLESSG